MRRSSCCSTIVEKVIFACLCFFVKDQLTIYTICVCIWALYSICPFFCQHYTVIVVVDQSLSHVQLLVTPWTAACQASLSLTNSWSLLKFMSNESVMPSNHPILCQPLLLLPSIFPCIRVFSNEPALCIRWPKYWSFSVSPSNEYSGLISFRIDCLISLLSK